MHCAKKAIRYLCAIAACAILLPLLGCAGKQDPPVTGTDDDISAGMTPESTIDTTSEEETTDMIQPASNAVNYRDKKCMWLSQFDLNKVYTNGGKQRDRAQFEKYIKKILANVKDNGINTIIVQVRPYADSMYPSDVYPMSS